MLPAGARSRANQGPGTKTTARRQPEIVRDQGRSYSTSLKTRMLPVGARSRANQSRGTKTTALRQPDTGSRPRSLLQHESPNPHAAGRSALAREPGPRHENHSAEATRDRSRPRSLLQHESQNPHAAGRSALAREPEPRHENHSAEATGHRFATKVAPTARISKPACCR